MKVVETLSSEFGLVSDAAPQLPVELLFVRGGNLIVASQSMAKIWSTAKGLQVVEAGQYLFSGVNTEPFVSWRPFAEAACILGRYARRRVLKLSPHELERLAANASETASASGQSPEPVLFEGVGAGPLVIAIYASLPPPSTLESAAVGYLMGHVDVVGEVSLPETSIAAAKNWAELFGIRSDRRGSS